ncbi:MAG: hypothetical protein PHD10_02810 [Bacilli bacterium]|nr:hypothetical protein [Bacilli bacterium]MDD4608042.1 hypothetical protein [Bacilli bacterium]
MLTIRNAYVAKFYDMYEDGNNMKLMIDEEATEHCYCVIDEKKKNAINIDTGEVYHILERDNNQRILPSEAINVIFNVPYVLDTEPINWKSMNVLEQRYICIKAFWANNVYKKEEKEQNKVKKLMK